jgi:hypothetical protein
MLAVVISGARMHRLGGSRCSNGSSSHMNVAAVDAVMIRSRAASTAMTFSPLEKSSKGISSAPRTRARRPSAPRRRAPRSPNSRFHRCVTSLASGSILVLRICEAVVERDSGRTAARISLHFASAQRFAARDGAERVRTPGDGWDCRPRCLCWSRPMSGTSRVGGDLRGAAGATCKSLALPTRSAELALRRDSGSVGRPKGIDAHGLLPPQRHGDLRQVVVQSAPPPLRRARRGHRHRRAIGSRDGPHRAWRSSHRVLLTRPGVLRAR